MISYAPLWETMKKRGATTYTLEFQGRDQQLLDTKIESRRICVDQHAGRAV